MNEKPYNAADPKQVKERRKKEQLRQEQFDNDFKTLLTNPMFRRFLWDVIHRRCKLVQSPFNPNGSTQTLNIGRQDVGRELWVDIEKIDPMVIPQMMTEYADWEAQDER